MFVYQLGSRSALAATVNVPQCCTGTVSADVMNASLITLVTGRRAPAYPIKRAPETMWLPARRFPALFFFLCRRFSTIHVPIGHGLKCLVILTDRISLHCAHTLAPSHRALASCYTSIEVSVNLDNTLEVFWKYLWLNVTASLCAKKETMYNFFNNYSF